jgi:hypothetical protein
MSDSESDDGSSCSSNESLEELKKDMKDLKRRLQISKQESSAARKRRQTERAEEYKRVVAAWAQEHSLHLVHVEHPSAARRGQYRVGSTKLKPLTSIIFRLDKVYVGLCPYDSDYDSLPICWISTSADPEATHAAGAMNCIAICYNYAGSNEFEYDLPGDPPAHVARTVPVWQRPAAAYEAVEAEPGWSFEKFAEVIATAPGFEKFARVPCVRAVSRVVYE